MRLARDPGDGAPLAYLARYDALLVGQCPAGPDRPAHDPLLRWRVQAESRAAAERLVADLGDPRDCAGDSAPAYRGELIEAPARARHEEAVRRALELIAAGDVYQVNLAGRFRVASSQPPDRAYAAMRSRQPVPHGAFLDAGDFAVLVNSPERFLRLTGDAVETRPIRARDREARLRPRIERSSASCSAIPRTRRARHDRRPGAQRPRPRVPTRERRGELVPRGRELRDAPPSRLDGSRQAPSRRRPRGAAARDLSGWLDHRCSEDPGDGGHRGARSAAARDLHRRVRPLSRPARSRLGHRDPRRGRSRRRVHLSRRGWHRRRLRPRARVRRVPPQGGSLPAVRRSLGRSSFATTAEALGPPPADIPWIWLGGRVLRADRARISVYDRGLLYGDAVFETVRFYDGEPFLWERHRRRLAASLAHFAIPAATDDLHGAALRCSLGIGSGCGRPHHRDPG